METKLTLKLDEAIIEAAKKYAAQRKKSLSRLVEDYFRRLSSEEPSLGGSINPVVKELSGVLSEKDLEGWRDGQAESLEQKYG